MNPEFSAHIDRQLDAIRAAGLSKDERILTTAQGARVETPAGPVLNFCANNYLGLARHPEVVAAARTGLDQWGYGLASVRFICGTQSIHKSLEQALSAFLGTEDTILYGSCFDANGGLFETLLGPEDAVLSDALNHASIIDGIRLCKAKRFRYANNDMADLRRKLEEADRAGARFKLIATDGVFSMDGFLARLPELCDLAGEFGALVMVDDSHAVGVLGPKGRGTPAHFGVADRVNLLTGTLGKALGGASGGYASGPRPVIELLRQRSRPYLFSNTLAPPIVAGSLRALELIASSDALRETLRANTRAFREGMARAGFDLLPGEHPIVPVLLYDAPRAADFARRMLARGVYVVAFSYPVVPEGRARIRVQLSAAHAPGDIEFALEQFAAVRRDLGG